ncbi:hypothetical protein ACFTAO_19475 [Paenibacillus rhizoplanae]
MFFPELGAMLDYSETRFLMQELLVDIVGEEARELDLLLETRYKGLEGYILIHLEPQSYRDNEFRERMFIYFSRLFERYRKDHKLIIPIAIFLLQMRSGRKRTRWRCPSPSIPFCASSFLRWSCVSRTGGGSSIQIMRWLLRY